MTAGYDDFERQWNATIERAVREVDARWSITGYKAHATHDGVAWVANLRLDGKVVCRLEQAGQGGDTRFDFYDRALDGNNAAAEKAWTDEIVRVLPDEGLYWGRDVLIEALLQKAGK